MQDRGWLASSKKVFRRHYSKSAGGSLSIDRDRSGSQSIRSGYWKKDCVWYESRSTGRQRKNSRRTTGALGIGAGVSSAEVQAESERAQLKLPSKGKKHPGRQELPAHLPRIEKIIACTPEQCVCGNCGKKTVVIGYEKSESSM